MADQQKNAQSYFEEVKLENMTLKNRIVMASLTRVRCNYGEEVANDLLVEHYSQRSGLGLIFTEASAVSQSGHSFPGAANCYTEKQKNGWKKVVDSVHQAGGKIFIQLTHGGRTALGNVVLAPSAIKISGTNPFTQKEFNTPTEMTLDDIKQVIQDFSYSASLAKEAGFDGVVLHGANGYLLDEFTRDGSNQRKDAYGGSISNRCRFVLEVVDAVVKVFGKGRVGIKISPTGRYNDMFDSDPIATYSYLLSKLDQKGIAFIEVKEAAPQEANNAKQTESKFKQPTEQCADVALALRNSFSGIFINNESFDYQKGLDRIKSGVCQMISFGRLALSNPDLAYRFQNNLPLNQIDYSTLFTNFGKGYNDYPTYEQSQKKEKSYFDKYCLKDLVLQNRIVMAPLTRERCDYKDLVPNDLVVEYYRQRGDFGLVITEATAVSKRGHTWPGAACLYNEAQRDGWKKVVDAVHEKGGKIFIQLVHGGRSADEEINGGLQTIAPSAIKIDDTNPWTKNPYKVPKEMTIEEIKGVIQQFKESAILAKQAGFDGVEVHSANGYLIDEFLRDGSNQRTDEYGGSVENRSRFCLEIVDQIIEVFGNKRVGVRVSPTGRYTDMYDSDPISLYTHLLQQLDKKNIAFVEIKEANKQQDCKKKNEKDDRKLPYDQCADLCVALKPAFSGTIINNDGFDYQSGLDRINSGVCGLISFGRYAISNPDLVLRFKNNWELSPYDYQTFFTHEAKGYTDYPTYQQLQEQKKQASAEKQIN